MSLQRRTPLRAKTELGRSTPLARGPGPQRKSTPKRSRRAGRDWTDAREKVDGEGHCRVCGRAGVKLDAAHIIPRSRMGAGMGGEHPDNIVPLCHERCHPAYDSGPLDLLAYLTIGEEAQAVRLAPGLVSPLKRITKRREWRPVEDAQEAA